MTSLKPKHLNFSEMWKLHKTIKDALPEKKEKYLIHEVSEIMSKMTNASFKDSLLVMYGSGFQNNKIPAELAIMFVRGLKQNDLFTFADFIKSISK